MPRLSQREAEAYLSEAHVAHLITVRPDGCPHVVPVWFDWEGETALVMTSGQAVKVRNVRGNPTVALSVATDQRPYIYVVLEGEARVHTDNLVEVVNRICVHYDGPERGYAYAQELLAEGAMVLIEIRVSRMNSWGESE